ncbi:amidohydrolase family protein [Alteribacillus iranensis]|uniref:Predicted metal-dependent hydrolase, TIM-barrel fold n=1 Tax=Alteribacillus iranensis TaxID=930128 RepID=A0A1I2F2Z3_9BACI|nr:amidohydrolase family protein [Alteribacillus iranensis]SFE99068.1 Predicted metal-dependent hydrolase, TIM-barrel fold [Alteribacillus iranensis]
MRTIFDAHLHIIDPRFPLIENQGFTPEPFTCKQYFERVRDIEVIGGTVVSGSFQGVDQSYLIDALHQLGKNFVGVTQLPYDTPDERIRELYHHGVRGVRFNVKRGGSEDISKLDSLAKKVYEVAGWHIELYMESTQLPQLAPIIEKLPAVSIDHLGLKNEGFHHLLSLVEKGVRVKATGFGRVDMNVERTLKAIYSINPQALMFGTDLPSTRANRPYHHQDIDIVSRTFSEAQAEDVLYKNALRWYGFLETR